jgi:TetR/AcrR family transcriptional regulator, transcriptional repressor for nem operon
MRTPDATKLLIIEKASELFNTYGYKATSISDITTKTGFTKGAIYRHFSDKAELEVAALDHMAGKVYHMLGTQIRAAKTADMKLRAVLDFFKTYLLNFALPGGCPLLNVAIEVDDKESLLKDHAQQLLTTLRATLIHIITKGIQFHQLQISIDAERAAAIMIASLEGAIMMSKLKNDDSDMNYVIDHLHEYIDTLKIKS